MTHCVPDPSRLRPTRLAAATLAAALCASAPCTAQTPADWDGWYAVCSSDTTYLSLGNGPGGIFMVHPTNGTVIPITGLPAELTGAGIADPQGARSLVHDPETGHLWVGEATHTGTPLSLWEIELTGAAARVLRRATAGQSSAPNENSGIRGLERHPDGRIFAILRNITQGPLAGFRLAVFDPRTNTFTGLSPTPPVSFIHDKLVLSHDGKTLYYGSATGQIPDITALDLATMRATVLAPRGNNKPVEIGPDGRLLMVGRDVQWFDPKTSVFTPCQPGPAAWQTGAGIERSTGSMALITMDPIFPNNPQQNMAFRIDGCAGTPVLLSAGPIGGWGTLTDIEVIQSPRAYGAPTPTSDLTWHVVASPGGRPMAGNANFALTLDAAPGTQPAGALLFGTSSGLVSLPGGVDLLIAPASLFVSIPVSLNAGPNNIPLPIPGNASLIGRPLRVQAASIANGGVTASDGLRLTIL